MVEPQAQGESEMIPLLPDSCGLVPLILHPHQRKSSLSLILYIHKTLATHTSSLQRQYLMI